MTDKLIPLNSGPDATTGAGPQTHSKAVREGGKRFDELLSERDADSDNGDAMGKSRSQWHGEQVPSYGNASSDAEGSSNGLDRYAGMAANDYEIDSSFMPAVQLRSSELETSVAELSRHIRDSYQQGQYVEAGQLITEFLESNPALTNTGNGVNGGTAQSSPPLQVLAEIMQFAEQMHAAVASNDFGSARRIAIVSAQSLQVLARDNPGLLSSDTAQHLMGHFNQVARALPNESTFWAPLAAGDTEQFIETAQEAALAFADINPLMQVAFNEIAMTAEAGPELGAFGSVTEATVGEVIEQLDAWQAGTAQQPAARASIEALIQQIGSGDGRSPSEINGFLTELADQGKLETLFEFYGEDRGALIDLLVSKGQQAVANDAWYEQAMIGVWNENGSNLPGRIEDAMRLSLNNGNQSMTRSMARDVFLAAGGPNGVLTTVAASEVESAQQSLVDTVTTNSNRFNRALEHARENGSVDELMLTLNRRGVLNLARAFTDPASFSLIRGEAPAAATPPPALSLEGLSDEQATAVANDMKALMDKVKASSTAFSTAVANAKNANAGTESSDWATTPDRALMQSAIELRKNLAALQPYRDIIADKNPESWKKLEDLGTTASKVARLQVSAAHEEIRVQRLTGDATTQQQEVRDAKDEFQQAIAYAKSIGTTDGVDTLEKRRAVVNVFQAANAYQDALEGLRPLVGNSSNAASIEAQISQVSTFATQWNETYKAELLQQGLAIQDGDRVGDGFRIKQQALAALQPLAEDPAAFAALIEQTYGTTVDPAKIESLRQKLLAGDMSWMPTIEFVEQATLGGAFGAYDGEVIYLQQELLNDPSAAVQTFIEEAGHALDNFFNGAPSAGGVDTAGDEGELFRRLVNGEALSSEQIAAIRSENDHGVITFDGREIEVEFLSLGDLNPFKIVTNIVETAVDLVEGAVDIVVDVVDEALDLVGDVVEEVGDLVVDVVEGVGDIAEEVWDFSVDVVEGVVDIGEEIIDFTVDVVEEVVEFGEEIVEFHLDVIEGAVDLYIDALEGAWDFVEEEVLQSEWFPVVLMVASFVPGLNVVATIGRAVYAGYNTYQGIANENWQQAAMGLISLSGAAQDLGFSNTVVTTVGQVGEAVMTGLTVEELIETGDINALLDLAGQYLPEGSTAQIWVDRLQVGSDAYDAAERGDLLGAVGLGAGLLGDLSPDGTGFESTLEQISDTALDGQALQNLIEDGDYGLAAQLINDNYGELLSLNNETGQNLVQLGEVLTHLEDAKHLIEDQDYLGAAQLLTNTASQHVGSPETQALLESTASALGQAGDGVAALESGDYNAALASFNQALGMPLDNETQAFLMRAGETAQQAQQIQQIFESGDYFAAASLAASLGESLVDNPVLQEHFNSTAEVLVKAEGINDAIESGDYLAAATLAAELGGSVVDNPTLQGHLENTANVLSQAQSIDAAWQQGDYAAAAQIAAQLAGEVIDNPALQAHLNNAADVLDRASGINDAIETGDYAAAAALSAELNAATINNPALASFFDKTSSLLGRAQGIQQAVDSGNYELAANLAMELADEAQDLPVFRDHFENVSNNLNEAQTVADSSDTDSADAATVAADTWVDPEDLFDDDRVTAAVDDTIALLDAWSFNPAERQVLDIVESIPASRFEDFMSQLESRGYEQTLFDSIDGAEHQQLRDIIADKTGTATNVDTPEGALFGVDAQGNYIDLTTFRETPALVADAGSVTSLDGGGQTMTDFEIKPLASYTSAMQAVLSADGLSMGDRYEMLVDTTKFYMTLWAQDSQEAVAESELDNQAYWVGASDLDPNLNRAAALFGRVGHNLAQGAVDIQSMFLDEDFRLEAGRALDDLITDPEGTADAFMDGVDAFGDLPLDQQIETGLEVVLTATVPSGGLSVGSRLPTPSAMGARAVEAFDGNMMAAAMTGGIRVTDDAVYIPRVNSSTLHGSIGVPSFDGSVIKMSRLSSTRTNEINMDTYRDPLTNEIVPAGDTKMSVDHIVPINELVKLEGFDRLTKEQMASIIQDKGDVPGGVIGNLMPLPGSMNSSKKNLNATDWATQGYRGQSLDADYVQWLTEARTEILDDARALIARYLNE